METQSFNNGVATTVPHHLNAGDYVFTAIYQGDVHFAAATTDPLLLMCTKDPTVTTFTAIGPTSVSTAVGVHVSVSTNPIAGGTLTISDLATGNVVHRESMYTGSWNGTVTGIKPGDHTLVATLDP